MKSSKFVTFSVLIILIILTIYFIIQSKNQTKENFTEVACQDYDESRSTCENAADNTGETQCKYIQGDKGDTHGYCIGKDEQKEWIRFNTV